MRPRIVFQYALPGAYTTKSQSSKLVEVRRGEKALCSACPDGRSGAADKELFILFNFLGAETDRCARSFLTYVVRYEPLIGRC